VILHSIDILAMCFGVTSPSNVACNMLMAMLNPVHSLTHVGQSADTENASQQSARGRSCSSYWRHFLSGSVVRL